ncbi:hypothetical protein MFAL_33280 [Mycolicibacterium fallax]|nr:hypothetical protein MFAL_33280 [Mycolicibacterium fallax]
MLGPSGNIAALVVPTVKVRAARPATSATAPALHPPVACWQSQWSNDQNLWMSLGMGA